MPFKDIDHCKDCGCSIEFKEFKENDGKCNEDAKNYCACGQWLTQFEHEELEGQCQACYNKGVQQKIEDTRHPDDRTSVIRAGR